VVLKHLRGRSADDGGHQQSSFTPIDLPSAPDLSSQLSRSSRLLRQLPLRDVPARHDSEWSLMRTAALASMSTQVDRSSRMRELAALPSTAPGSGRRKVQSVRAHSPRTLRASTGVTECLIVDAEDQPSRAKLVLPRQYQPQRHAPRCRHGHATSAENTKQRRSLPHRLRCRGATGFCGACSSNP